MKAWFRGLVWLGFLILSAAWLHAGGSGLNVLLVVNQASTNSIQLGNYFAEQRQVPPQNTVRIYWTGGNINWNSDQYRTNLLVPVTNAIVARGLSNQIDYIVLSMDIPYQVIATNGEDSTTAALFYGFKTDDCSNNCPEGIPGCNLPAASFNPYVGSEGIFRQFQPNTPASNWWLVTMITSSNLALAKAIIDQGVAGDSTFPTQQVILGKSTDTVRNVRFVLFDDAVFDARVRGSYALIETNSNSPNGLTNLLGYQNGLLRFDIQSNTFIPGAMADSLTSYAGGILRPNDHTTVLAFLFAGAAGSYGTVVEPCNYLQKFPTPHDYFYQQRGFSLAECFYQSVTNPYQGLTVAEPLSAPFARPGSGAWSHLTANSVLAGSTNLALQFIAADASRPLQQVDLFVDGQLFATLTNIPPEPGNQVQAVVNSQALGYTVLDGDAIADVASGLAAEFNWPSNQLLLQINATAHGDRIELQSSDTNLTGINITNSVTSLTNTAGVLTTFISASRTNFLDTVARGRLEIDIAGTLVVGDYLQLSATKTNGATTTVSVTNSLSNGNVGQFVQTFVNAINAAADLQGVDGLTAEDLYVEVLDANTGLAFTSFNLRPRSIGWAAAGLQAQVTGTFTIAPVTVQQLAGNLGDLQPRNHFYVTAGVTNLALTFPFDTTAQADGYHTLTAVAYEGSHVRTQTRLSQNVRIQNTPLSAAFTCLVCDTNTALEATLQFSVAANTNNITNIELFSTGGLLASAANQSSAVFSVAGTNLGLGLHPFYALVTRADGQQYRTETKWIRLIGADSPFRVAVAPRSTALSWTATAGRRYDVLSATNITDTLGVRDSVTPTNAAGKWTDTNSDAPQQFYRVRTSP